MLAALAAKGYKQPNSVTSSPGSFSSSSSSSPVLPFSPQQQQQQSVQLMCDTCNVPAYGPVCYKCARLAAGGPTSVAVAAIEKDLITCHLSRATINHIVNRNYSDLDDNFLPPPLFSAAPLPSSGSANGVPVSAILPGGAQLVLQQTITSSGPHGGRGSTTGPRRVTNAIEWIRAYDVLCTAIMHVEPTRRADLDGYRLLFYTYTDSKGWFGWERWR
jgi:hypothetical protein